MQIGGSTDVFDELEIATVDKILAKRYDPFKRQTEYLVAWKEYPGEDTWESIENLSSVKEMIEDFENAKKLKQQQYQKDLREKLEKLRQREV